MSKHTNGPWEIHTAQNGRTIFQIGPCAPEEYAGSAWLDVSMEDARLIAAAPELYEELVDADAQMQKAYECVETGRYYEALLHLASMSRSRREVIAKARG